MVQLVVYQFNKLLDKCRGQSDGSLITNWRSKGMLSPLGRSIIQKGNRTVDVDKKLKRENMKMLKINPSMVDTIKHSIDRGVSEYWGDALRYHWPIAIQSFLLVIIILTLGPWIGCIHCNDDVSIVVNKNDYLSSFWRPFIESTKSSSTSIRETCTYGYFCSNKKSHSGEPVRRKASFLKRRRYLKSATD